MVFNINRMNRSVARPRSQAYKPSGILRQTKSVAVSRNESSKYNQILNGSNSASRLTKVEPFMLYGEPNPNMMYTAILPKQGYKFVYDSRGRHQIPSITPVIRTNETAGKTDGIKKKDPKFIVDTRHLKRSIW